MGVVLNCTHPLASPAGNVSVDVIRSLLEQEEEREFLLKIPAMICLLIYFFLGIPGNLLVIVIYYYKFRASTTKSFILSLATFDLISCLIGLPYEMVDLRFDMELDMVALCKILRFVVTLCACGSTTVLLSVAADRFRRICQPFKKQMSVKQSKIVLIGITLISFVIAMPALILYGSRTEIYRGVALVDCTIDDRWAKTSFSNGYQFVLGVLWIASIFILCIMYGVIIYKIRKQEIRRLNLTCNSMASLNVSRFNSLGPTVKHKVSPSINGKDQHVVKENNAGDSRLTVKIGVQESEIIPDEKKVSAEDEDAGMRQRNSFNRMFSRDVNPIYEEEDEAHAQRSSKTPLCDVAEHEDDDECDDTTATQNGGFISSEETSEEKSGSLVIISVEFDSQNEDTGNGRGYSTLHKYNSESLISTTIYDSECAGYDLSTKNRCSSVPCLKESCPPCDSDANLTSYDNDAHASDDIQYERSCSLSTASNFGGEASLNCDEFDTNKKINKAQGEIHSIDNSCEVHRLSEDTEGQTDQDADPTEDNFVDQSRERNISAVSMNSQRLEIPGKRCGFEDKSLDQIATRLDQSNGSMLTLHDSKVMTDRHRNISTVTNRSSIVRQLSSNSTNNSIQINRRSKTNSVSSQSSGGRTNATSVTYYNRKQSTVSTRELKTSKIAVMMFHVTMVHVLSYLPHLAIQFHRVLSAVSLASLQCNPVYFAFFHIFLRSIYLNNAMNPIIYSYNNGQFRQYCQQLLTKPLAFCRRRSATYTIDSAHSLTMDEK